MEKLEIYYWITMYVAFGFLLMSKSDFSPIETFWAVVFWPLGVAYATYTEVRAIVSNYNRK